MNFPGVADKSKRWWGVVAGTLGFLLIGFAMAPGLISREPTPVPTLAVLAEVPTRATLYEPTATVAPAQLLDMNLPPSGAAAGGFGPDTFDCMISANEIIQIGSPILGVIESILVERSEYVEKGQVLATLESSVEKAAVRIAQARADRTVELESTRVSLKLGKKRRTRAIDLYNEKSMSLDLREEIETEARLSELGVEQAKENHLLALLQLEQAKATLARRTFRSPVAGFVVDRLMAPGEVVDKETLLEIAQTDPLRIEMILPTHLFGSVVPGDSVEIIPERPLDQPRIAQVAIVDRMLDGASGTFGVRMLLPNPDYSLPGGLRCRARLLPDGVGFAAAQ